MLIMEHMIEGAESPIATATRGSDAHCGVISSMPARPLNPPGEETDGVIQQNLLTHTEL